MTRVGVLECDHVDERFRSIAGDGVDMLRTMFDRHVPGSVRINQPAGVEVNR